MSEFTQNNVILGTPAKGYNIMIMSLFEQNKDIFKMLKMSLGSTVNNKARRFISTYIWDLYKLADLTKDTENDPSRPGYFTFLPTNNKWKKLYTSNFNDNTGSGIYSKLSNFNPLAVQNHPNFNAQKYDCDFSFSPLINIGFNVDYTNVIAGLDPELPGLLSDQYEAEQVIYLASKIPMFPMMMCSTIPAHYSFGPIFAQQIQYSCNGNGNLPIVNVTCRFEGGKALIAPAFTGNDRKKPTPEPIIYNQMNDLEDNPITETASLYGYAVDYHRYRSASMIDCMIDFNEYENLGDMKNAVVSNISLPPVFKITGFDLSITQNIEYSFTYPGSTNDDYTINYYGDKVGPKYASLSSREVTGSIKYFSFDKDVILPNTSSLTMYFGGPFFFSMKYVDWNNPTVNIEPNSGYTHTYTFRARLTDNVGFPQSDNLDQVVSEFTGNSTFTIQSLFDLLNKWFRF